MYVLIVGAGPVGASLVDLAVEKGHEVAVIEPDQDRARTVLKRHDIRVFNSSLAADNIFEEVSAARADAVIATTEDDAVNLMAIALAKQYGVRHRVSVVNEPSHARLLEQFEAEVMVHPGMILAQHLLQKLED